MISRQRGTFPDTHINVLLKMYEEATIIIATILSL